MPRSDRGPMSRIAAGLLLVALALLVAAVLLPANGSTFALAAAVVALAAGAVVLVAWRRASADTAAEAAARQGIEEQLASARGQLEGATTTVSAIRQELSMLRDAAAAMEDAATARDAESTALRARAREAEVTGHLIAAEAERVAGRHASQVVDAAQRRVDRARSEAAQLNERAETARRERTELQHQLTRRLEDKDAEIERLQGERGTLQRGRTLERQWIVELRTKVLELQREQGTLGDPATIPALVLRIAITLLEAEKGLLLSRRDEDDDGNLELLATQGFEHDASDSELCQELAQRAVEADRVLRDDDLPHIVRSTKTPADREIRSLVAIPIYILDRFSGIVVAANRPGGFGDFDQEVLLALGGQAGALLQNTRLHSKLRGSYLATVGVLADAMEAKDGSLRGHGDDVARYAAAVADRIGMSAERREEVAFASLLHDIGKIGISERILLKPAALTVEEYAIVKLHPRIGHRLAASVPALARIAPAILHHHERFDGGGYPAGLVGDRIPQEARLIAVADSFSAMTAERPYRQPRTVDDALRELERHAGTQFDPQIVRLFVDEVERKPPRDELTGVGEAFEDPDVIAQREGNETLLGAGGYELVDNLTLLGSTRRLHDTLAAEGERAALQTSPFSVVVVELDGIGDLNEEHGFAAGDAALQAAARVVERVGAGCGGTAYRLSGRRLAIVAPRGDATASELAADVRRELREGPPVRCGVATWRPDDHDGKAVLGRAVDGIEGS